jgi:hypothetical protein
VLRGALGVAGLALLAAMLFAGQRASPAEAAPCPAPTFSGNLDIAGTAPCDVDSEIFNVYCNAGNVFVDYGVNDTIQGPFDSGVACSMPTRISVDGYFGGDRIDLSRVSAADGFTGINQPNQLNGSFGNDELIGSPLPDAVSGSIGSDIVLVRDGSADNVDCGPDFDYAQADLASTDSLSNCEVADYLPTAATPTAATPPAATPPPATPKKCKRKRHRKTRACKHRKR